MKNLVKLLAFVLTASLVFINCGGGPAGPKEVVEESFKMMENNDQSGVKNLLSAQVKSLVDDKKLEEGLNKKYEEIQSKGGIANIEFVSEDIQENEANFKVKLTYGDGSSDTEKANVVKEDGKWRLGAAK